MEKNFTRLVHALLILLLPLLAVSQDHALYLNAGKFTPAENASSVTKTDDVFTQSRFGNKNYVTLQFRQLPSVQQKEQMRAAGIQLLDYIPHLAYTAALQENVDPSVLPGFGVRSILHFNTAQKTVPDILIKKVPDYAVKARGYADVDILLYETMESMRVMPSITALGAAIIADVPVFRMMTIRVPQENLRALVDLPFVQWAEYIAPPNVPENLPGRTLHRASVLNDGVRNLKGDGMKIGIWDERASQHLDFSPTGRLINESAGAAGSHGTHVSGTVGGRGLINPVARGMAPNATLHSYYAFSGDVQVSMATEVPAKTLISSNHSYHDGLGVQCSLTGASASYSLRSRNTDINLNNNPYHLHCHSAGNAQTSCAGGWLTITGTGKSAKNNVVVAALTSGENMTSYSSFGPVHDGRVKPEIAAMGDGVFSTYTPLNTYGTISGTSMSTPGITGTLALLAQRYKELNGNVLPPSALIKNIACNTAHDLGNAGPDYRFGFGRINALKAVRILEENRYALNNIATGSTNDITINVPAGATRLRVMLTWNDPAAAANASLALVNNLDLRVVEGANTYLPWILDPTNPSLPATQADDNISNIEQVTVLNPPAGSYTLRVIGEAVPTGPTQDYALTWEVEQPFIEVIYPNGGEAFNPSSPTQVITWDNSGVTGTQTVQYSLDNGGSWTTISSSVAATTTRLNWTVPAANTSQALIRVSSGALVDQSDATFKILGTVTGFAGNNASCNAGEVIFTWNAVTNATHYDIYRLDPSTGYFVILASDITGTTYTATGLTPGASMWFTIVSKNNSTLANSERANAINVSVSNGSGGLGVVGSITGQNIVCGTPSGLVYSIAAVSGATGYNWTVPPGAVLASGQGTTSITVNYPAGSANGNVAVSATNATCQSSPSVLPISIGGSNIPSPLTGGDQSVTVCPGNPIPTLTANATVGSGFTLVWYTAPTGGSVVSSPTFNTAGSVTYYAAARDANGCESLTRTPVTLTITLVPAASITAGGPTTICQGSSVTLTANSGGSYLWSNGATTSSITVSTAGSYTVQVTTGSCVSTSPAVNVVVNPAPVASVSAGGPTTFCQGLNVVLTASAGSSWLWSNGATTQSITVNTSGNYSVTVTGANGCSATSTSTSVTVNPNPPAVINAGSATTFCDGGSVTLTANSGTAYLWSNGATTQSININGPVGTSNYTVQVTQAGGCISNSPATSVTVNPLPVANITAGGPTTVCEPNSVTLTASAGSSWLWSNGATTQSITISSPAASGSYNVRVTNANGCAATSGNTNVTINPRPSVSLSAAPYTRLFPGLNTTLSANVSPAGTYTYNWTLNGNAVTGATSSTWPVTLTNLGTYAVTATNTAGCSNTSAQLVIADSASRKLFIMPNPNSGQFEISYYSTGTNTYSVTITDAKGALVYNKAYAINSPYQRLAVDLRKNNAGIYFVFLTDNKGNRIATGKVLINR